MSECITCGGVTKNTLRRSLCKIRDSYRFVDVLFVLWRFLSVLLSHWCSSFTLWSTERDDVQVRTLSECIACGVVTKNTLRRSLCKIRGRHRFVDLVFV